MNNSHIYITTLLIFIVQLLSIWTGRSLCAQDEFNNPLIYGLNREKPHASYKIDDEKVFRLDGEWQFEYFNEQEEIPKGFQLNGFDASEWETIRIPSSIDVSEYNVSENTGQETAIYLKDFELPEIDKDQQLILRFDGANPAYHIWINGFMIGYSKGVGVPAEFNLTPFVKGGANKVAVKVYISEEEESLNGITDNVSVILREALHLRDLKTEYYFNDSQTQVLLRLNLYLESFLQGANTGRTINVSILSPDYQVIFSEQQQIDYPISFRQEVEINIDHSIQNPLLWSPENPNLYQIKVGVTENENGVSEFIRTNIGFRKIENLDSAIVLNQDTIPLLMCEQADLGFDYFLDEEVYIGFLDENGYNALRIYNPLPDRMMDMFDRNGILVWHEWSEGAMLSDSMAISPELRKSLLDQAAYQFGKDVNRACIIRK